MSSKQRVAYYYDTNWGNYYYGPGHPMKPQRLKLAHNLLVSYGVYRKLEVYKPHYASQEEMAAFHADDYIDFLRRVTPDNAKDYANQMGKFNVGEQTDCPLFDGVYDYSALSSGASLDSAWRLNQGHADVCVNWAGGLHHAKKSEASGFCYINDIVLAILELLKYHPRVLYIDIDVHHGDGVEEAFYVTDRVMTVSFHKFGDFFPGTGDLKDIGAKSGKYYSINVPLREGIDDLSYEHIFKPVIAKVMEMYNPSAIVLQCGADSLTQDRLGCFNLTLKGHAECVKFVKSYGRPTIVLGGGGYTIRNVARCWAYETAVLVNEELDDTIPNHPYVEYFAPDYRLHLAPSSMENMNDRDYLDRLRTTVLSNLSMLQGAPSVPFQEIPPDWAIHDRDDDTLRKDPDVRDPAPEGRKEHEAEFYENERDHDEPEAASRADAEEGGDVDMEPPSKQAKTSEDASIPEE